MARFIDIYLRFKFEPKKLTKHICPLVVREKRGYSLSEAELIITS